MIALGVHCIQFTRFVVSDAGILSHASSTAYSGLLCFKVPFLHFFVKYFPHLFDRVDIARVGRSVKLFRRVVQSHNLVLYAVCFGSLSCMKIQSLPSGIFSTLSGNSFFNILIYCVWSIIPSIIWMCAKTWWAPYRLPHTHRDPPPCFTVGVRFFGSKSTSFFLHILGFFFATS